MADTLSEKAHKAAVKQVSTDHPSQFRVGATWDGKKATGGISFDRTWSNLWGITAYAKGYWNDQLVIPTDKYGYVVGVEAVKPFKKRF